MTHPGPEEPPEPRGTLRPPSARALTVCAVVALLGTVDALAKDDGLQAVKRAGQTELREHAVDSVDRFVHILEHENRPVERREIRRANERGEHREVSTFEPTARATRSKHARMLGHAARIPALECALQ